MEREKERKRPAWFCILLLLITLISFAKYLASGEADKPIQPQPYVTTLSRRTETEYTSTEYTMPSADYETEEDPSENEEEPTASPAEYTTETATEPEKITDDNPEPPEYCLYYEQLNENGKYLYRDMYATVTAGGRTGCVEDRNYFDGTEYIKALYAFIYDNPQFFWLSRAALFDSEYNRSTQKMDFTYELKDWDFWTYSNNQGKYVDKLNESVKLITDEANKLSSDYEKALFVHDYLIRNSYYDYDRLDEVEKTIHDPICDSIRSAYGCLVEKRCVCAGYAFAYSLVLHELGIPCYYLTGDAGGSHAWNLIKLGDSAYYVDVTWDDCPIPDYPDDTPNAPLYDYCNITEKTLNFDHEVDKEFFTFPVCDSSEYNYFVYNDYRFDTYDAEKIKSAVSEQLQNGSAAYIQFLKESDYDKMISMLLNGEYTGIPPVDNGECYFYYNDESYIITILHY